MPDLLRPHLKALAEGKRPEEALFGHHWRDWVRKSVGTVLSSAVSPRHFVADKKSYVHFRGLDPAPTPALRGGTQGRNPVAPKGPPFP